MLISRRHNFYSQRKPLVHHEVLLHSRQAYQDCKIVITNKRMCYNRRRCIVRLASNNNKSETGLHYVRDLFLLVIIYITNRTTKRGKTGMKWNFTTKKDEQSQRNESKFQRTKIEDVDTFTYLGWVVNFTGDCDEDIPNRSRKAKIYFRRFRKKCSSTKCSNYTKVKFYNSLVLSGITYENETWKTTDRNRKKPARHEKDWHISEQVSEIDV